MSCTQQVGEPEECLLHVLSLKGPGIADSVVVSRYQTHDCPNPQFIWSEKLPLLIVETNNSKCGGLLTTQFFDLSRQVISHTEKGQLWLYDKKNDVAIIQHASADKPDAGNKATPWFHLSAYDVLKNKASVIFSLESFTFDCTAGRPEITFLESADRMLKIRFPENENRHEIHISY